METVRDSDHAYLLAQLESEERAISIRRQRKQERIDFIRSGRAVDVPDTEASLARLLREEQELSARRRNLHTQIDELRIRLGQQPGPRKRPTLLG